jgi:hypothetical protein
MEMPMFELQQEQKRKLRIRLPERGRDDRP